jgi:hypothetical protein
VVKLWSLEEGLLLYTLPVDFELVEDLEWSPDGAFFAASVQGTVRIFERVQGDLVDTIGGHSQLAWSPNGEYLAVNRPQEQRRSVRGMPGPPPTLRRGAALPTQPGRVHETHRTPVALVRRVWVHQSHLEVFDS